jgi:hypothetical protein
MRLVTIASFTDPHAAYLAKARLEAEGIHAFVADDALVQMNWLYSAAIGGVKVQVDENDERDAARILNEDHRAELTSNDEAELSPDVDPACPRCASTTVGLQRIARFGVALTLLLGFPVKPLEPRLRCSRCGHTWKPTDDSTGEYAEETPADFLRAAWPAIVISLAVIGLAYFVSRRFSAF